jgi:thymidylate synthase (FAD)
MALDLIEHHYGKVRPTIKCLDHGFVTLRDCMPRIIETDQVEEWTRQHGSLEGFVATADPAITEAARVSYQKGTKSVNEDRGLIRYLYRHSHTTPFEMVEFKLHCSMPIFVARQWIRHRTANVNEMSGRYSILPNEFYLPAANGIRAQSKTNKQGSEGQIEETDAQGFADYLTQFCADAYAKYEEAVANGVGREQARMILPTNLYTSWYWKIDLHNLLHFLKLRCDSHAQYEIRVFADAILELITPIVPWTIEAWDDYCPYRGAKTFSRLELAKFKELLKGQWTPGDIRSMISRDAPAVVLGSGNKREDGEWIEKLKSLVS